MDGDGTTRDDNPNIRDVNMNDIRTVTATFAPLPLGITAFYPPVGPVLQGYGLAVECFCGWRRAVRSYISVV